MSDQSRKLSPSEFLAELKSGKIEEGLRPDPPLPLRHRRAPPAARATAIWTT